MKRPLLMFSYRGHPQNVTFQYRNNWSTEGATGAVTILVVMSFSPKKPSWPATSSGSTTVPINVHTHTNSYTHCCGCIPGCLQTDALPLPVHTLWRRNMSYRASFIQGETQKMTRCYHGNSVSGAAVQHEHTCWLIMKLPHFLVPFRSSLRNAAPVFYMVKKREQYPVTRSEKQTNNGLCYQHLLMVNTKVDKLDEEVSLVFFPLVIFPSTPSYLSVFALV